LLPARRMGSLGSDVGQRYCGAAVVRGLGKQGGMLCLLNKRERIRATRGWRGGG